MRHVFITGLLLAALSTQAADYKSLVFETASGTTAVDLSSLVLTVENGTLVAKNSATSQTFTLTDLSKMYFSNEESTGISSVEASDADAAVEVIDIAGREVGSFASLAEAKSTLRQGIYVVRQGSRTFKIVVK